MIRKLEIKDIDACIDICNVNFQQEGYSYDTRQEFMAQFNVGSVITPEFYVYEEGGVIKGVAGLANCWFDDDAYGLCTCYVMPEWHGNGIGRMLTEFRINRIKELGGAFIFSTTKKEWHLKRFGFETIKSPYKEWKLMQLVLEVQPTSI